MQLGLNSEEEVSTSYICQVVDRINSHGVWFGDDPLNFSVPLLLLQLSLISIFTRAIYCLLKPFGQPSIVSHILGGVVLGPSILGRSSDFAFRIFPPKGRAMFETLSAFGFMLFVFLIGVKMDPNMLLRSGKRAVAIGFLAFSIPYAVAGLFAISLNHFLSLDSAISSALPYVVGIHSLTAFPSVSCFLDELRILNSEMGRLAASSSMACDIFFGSIVAVKFVLHLASQRSIVMSIGYLFSVGVLFVSIICGIRPAVLWAIRQTPEGEPAKDIYIIAILVTLMLCGFLGEAIGLNAFAPCFFLGLVIPDGPPLGAALVEKLDCFVSDLLMPIFFTLCGLRMDVFSIQQFKNVAVIQLIIFAALCGKVIGSALPPLFFRMPLLDALSLGLIMNAKGVVEIFILLTWKADNLLNEECFSILVISMVVVTAVVSPLVKAIYDPSKRFLAYRRRTIQHHRPGEELRILACVHRQDNVPPIMDLIAASNPTAAGPINLTVLHLLKLTGRASSLLVPHVPRDHGGSTGKKSSSPRHSRPTQSERIFNAFRKFERHYIDRHVVVNCFKGISPYASMHNDVCSLALERRSTLIIVPYHKLWIGGTLVESSHYLQNLNRNVLDKAPCSVGVLVDRGDRRKALSALRINTSVFRVAVLFFGGADDREALAYAARMAKHSNVLTTLFCFSSDTFSAGAAEDYDDEEEEDEGVARMAGPGRSVRSKALDTDILSKFRLSHFRDDRVSFEDSAMADGEAVLRVLRSLDGAFELVVVGRRHEDSPWFVSELGKWKEQHGELGAVGEFLAGSDIRIGASVLVVQQQTRVWGLRDPEQSMRLRKESMRQDIL